MSDKLSPRERAELRDLVLRGSRRIRPSGAHRAQIIAGAVALALVGTISGGFVAASVVANRQEPVPIVTHTPTPTPTPSPTPTPTPTPTMEPLSLGVAPYGGECANTLTEAEAGELTGVRMHRSDFYWSTGSRDVLGGLDCFWLEEDNMTGPTVRFWAYPVAAVPGSVRDAYTSGCADRCRAVAVRDGMWFAIENAAPRPDPSALEQMLERAMSRYADHAKARIADRTDRWWTVPDCPDILALVDPAWLGYERVSPAPDQILELGGVSPRAMDYLAGSIGGCTLQFQSGSGDRPTESVVSVAVVPGGAVAFPTVLASVNAVVLDIDGAKGAVWALGLDRYEASASILVVTDGVNLLMLSPEDSIAGVESVRDLAAGLITVIGD